MCMRSTANIGKFLKFILPFLAQLGLANASISAPVTVSLLNPESDLKQELQQYIGNFANTINNNWPQTTESAACSATVYFTVTPEGGISRFEIRESSGYVEFDDKAVQAIYRGSPYPPPPLRRESFLKMLATFSTVAEPAVRIERRQQDSYVDAEEGSQESMKIKSRTADLPQLYLSSEASPQECEVALRTWFSIPPSQRYGIELVLPTTPKKPSRPSRT